MFLHIDKCNLLLKILIKVEYSIEMSVIQEGLKNSFSYVRTPEKEFAAFIF